MGAIKKSGAVRSRVATVLLPWAIKQIIAELAFITARSSCSASSFLRARGRLTSRTKRISRFQISAVASISLSSSRKAERHARLSAPPRVCQNGRV
jgi:hypothetical protein